MRHDLEQERIVVAEMSKAITTAKSSSSTMPTTSLAKPQTLQTTTKARSSSPFCEKKKKMLELIAKLLSKKLKPTQL